MYAPHTCEKDNKWLGEKKYRLADFFDQWWDIYKVSPKEPIYSEQYKAVNAMRTCRTLALGIDYHSCPNCGEITKVYHSCKNRFCPTCSWQDTLKWAERIKNQMMDLPHRHTVITLPHQLNELIKNNKNELLSLLMRVSANTFSDWMGHKYNIKPGIISVLHTFGETKDYHVHVHMIVSWGGIDKQTSALKPVKGEYVNYNFLKKKFRCKFEDELISMFDNELLKHNFSDRRSFLQFIKRINKKRWIIHLEPPMDIPSQVVRYIGRYSKRACLSEYKITKIEGENISFRYKDYKTKDNNNKPVEREIKLNYRDFFPRLLQHVPLKYFRIVRYYGMYSNRASIPQEYLSTENNEPENENTDNWETLQIEKTGKNPLMCSHCQKRKIYLYTKLRSRKDNKIITFKRILLCKNEFRKGDAA
jgi:DNA-directed RNA polymerase subunit M/transcription elongation factor TFIIS